MANIPKYFYFRVHANKTSIEIEDASDADVVEVVRCKDCKYFDSGTDEDGKPFFKCLGWVYGGTSEDDFCSFGERKGSEQE
jgi:hypothetical protein